MKDFYRFGSFRLARTLLKESRVSHRRDKRTILKDALITHAFQILAVGGYNVDFMAECIAAEVGIGIPLLLH